MKKQYFPIFSTKIALITTSLLLGNVLLSTAKADLPALEKEVQHLRQRVSQLRIDMQRNDASLKKTIQMLSEKVETLSSVQATTPITENAPNSPAALSQLLRQKEEKIKQLEAEVLEIKQALANSATANTTTLSNTSTSSIEVAAPSEEIETITKTSQRTLVDIPVANKHYEQGVNLLSKSDYDGAQNIFSEIIKTYPNSTRAPDSLYWLAEAFYLKGDYSSAYTEYRRLASDYPEDKKKGVALLKMGLSKMELEEYQAAENLFNLVIEQYPESRVSQEAAYKLGLLKILQQQN